MPLSDVSEYQPTVVPNIGSHAVVIGGGIAGLLSARVLIDAFEEVTLLERDSIPDDVVARRGLPQGQHVHVLLEAGRSILTDLFPGFQDDLKAAGGVIIDAGKELEYHEQGDYLADCTEPLPMCCASRPLFQDVVRRRVADQDGITIRPECHFTGYRTNDAITTVKGVDFTNQEGENETLQADLVVDATGRTSRTASWLDDHGYQSPPVDTVNVDLAYSTVRVNRPAEDTKAYLCVPSAPDTHGGAAVPIENEQWIVTLFGMFGSHPPTTQNELIQFAKSLASPKIATLLEDQNWSSEEIQHYPFPSNQWRHYEQLQDFPEGLLVTGDAIASFNPIYGQGMSVAALDAMRLHRTLADGKTDLALRFFDRVSEHIDIVWRIAVGSDFEFPQTEGPKPLGTDLFNRYLSRLVTTAHNDPQVSTEFYRVLRLEKPPTTLLKPGIAGRVLLPDLLT